MYDKIADMYQKSKPKMIETNSKPIEKLSDVAGEILHPTPKSYLSPELNTKHNLLNLS